MLYLHFGQIQYFFKVLKTDFTIQYFFNALNAMCEPCGKMGKNSWHLEKVPSSNKNVPQKQLASPSLLYG